MKLNRSLLILTLLFVCASSAVVTGDDGPRSVSSGVNARENRQWEVTGPWGGDVRALVASPVDSDVFYLGTADGQIFHSTDSARTWRRLKPGLDKRGLSVDNIVIDPRNPQTIYAGAWAVVYDRKGGSKPTVDNTGSCSMEPKNCRFARLLLHLLTRAF
jgi:hypothetical protein